jgi:hypothetical protein
MNTAAQVEMNAIFTNAPELLRQILGPLFGIGYNDFSDSAMK